jgi:hypothetical protein
MTITMAVTLVAVPVGVLLILGGLVIRTVTKGHQETEGQEPSQRGHSGPMFRFRRTHPGGHDWEPLRITVRELRGHGLRQWPQAPGVYFPHDDSLHCRRCVSDPRTRSAVVGRRPDHDQMLVLFGGEDEGALVDDNCATHARTAA